MAPVLCPHCSRPLLSQAAPRCSFCGGPIVDAGRVAQQEPEPAENVRPRASAPVVAERAAGTALVLDAETTRERFEAWVRSPRFDGQYNAMAPRAIWPFVVGGLLILSLVGSWFGVGFVIYGFVRESRRKKGRSLAHLPFAEHQPILTVLVIGNRELFQKKGAIAPALLVGGFGVQDEALIQDVFEAAAVISELYGEDPANVAPEHRVACELVNDDTYRPDRRRPVPPQIAPRHQLWLFDTVLLGDNFDSGQADNPFIPCMATPGETGTIAQLPPGIAVFPERPYRPNIIRHQPRTEPPPFVAPIAENENAIVEHIEAHLGEPSTVFHEIISTTVHIDIHIVPPTPRWPWVSLVTSGMSDIPMAVPEGAEEFRFAELMIRLPEDWKLPEGFAPSDETARDESWYWPFRWLKFLARFAHEAETWLGHGHSIPNGDPPGPLADGVAFTGVVLSRPWYGGPNFATLKLADGAPVHFWSLIPVHRSEMEFKLQHGADALFEKLAADGYSDLFDPTRPPVA